MKTKTNGLVKFKVESGIPLPGLTSGANKKYDWPFGTMKVGENFYFPINGTGVIAVSTARNKVMTTAREHRILGKRFATRYVEDKNAIGVWRIA